MLYKIKYKKDGDVIRVTPLKFHSWEEASHFLKRIMKYKYINQVGYTKKGITAEILAQNGIPF